MTGVTRLGLTTRAGAGAVCTELDRDGAATGNYPSRGPRHPSPLVAAALDQDVEHDAGLSTARDNQ
jgi:hypothetical protein